ncbi:MAG TPA: DUF4893 domain-containing protein [Allosphingosinicella sp.]|jgi:hypothetical protein
MARLHPVWLVATLAAASCQRVPPPAAEAPRPSVTVEEAEPWRRVASPGDAAALDSLAAGWERALAAARAAGLARRVAAEGALLAPGAGLPRAAPPPGPYRCRYVRLGARKWTASAQAYCYVGVEAGQLSLATELRGLRLGGYLWEVKSADRLVFLGAAARAGSRTASAYGDNPAADARGLVERIGDFRYRLVLAEPDSAAELVVVDLVAAPRT